MTARAGWGLVCALILDGLICGAPASAQQKDRPSVVTTLTIFAGTEKGAYRSRNWGLDWEKLKHPGLVGLGAVHSILPLGPRVYMGGDGGLYVSDDDGDTWKRALRRDARADGAVVALSERRIRRCSPARRRVS